MLSSSVRRLTGPCCWSALLPKCLMYSVCMLLLGICAQARASGQDLTATAPCTAVGTGAAVRTAHQTATQSIVNVAHPAAPSNRNHRCHPARAGPIPAARTGSLRIRLLQSDPSGMGFLVSSASDLPSPLVSSNIKPFGCPNVWLWALTIRSMGVVV